MFGPREISKALAIAQRIDVKTAMVTEAATPEQRADVLRRTVELMKGAGSSVQLITAKVDGKPCLALVCAPPGVDLKGLF